ncbi:MAG: class I SAM-dependent methyltransferase [Acidobacteriota bacterium]
MKSSSLSHFGRRNQEAWDRLYARRPEMIWGREPVGFLDDELGRIVGRLDADSRMLDAACGEGRNLPALARLPGALHACDASAHALEKAASWLPPGIEMRRCELESLTFDDEFFDFILACDVLQTLPDLPSALFQLRRVLKPRGHLMCNIPSLDDGIAGEGMTPLRRSEYLYRDRYFFRFLDVEEARAELRAAGFEVIHQTRHTWIESSHPGYRDEPHRHTSWVYVARRVED